MNQSLEIGQEIRLLLKNTQRLATQLPCLIAREPLSVGLAMFPFDRPL